MLHIIVALQMGEMLLKLRSKCCLDHALFKEAKQICEKIIPIDELGTQLSFLRHVDTYTFQVQSYWVLEHDNPHLH